VGLKRIEELVRAQF